MKAHELAKKLLELSNLDVVIVKPAGGPYTEDYEVIGFPWIDLSGSIRIQIGQPEGNEKVHS